jgi:ATP-binding cassette subfamily F protein uup
MSTAAPSTFIKENKPQHNIEKREQLSKKKLTYKEQRELESLPGVIAALEAEQHRISQTLADGTLFVSDPHRAASLSQRHTDIDDELLAAMERQELLGG